MLKIVSSLLVFLLVLAGSSGAKTTSKSKKTMMAPDDDIDIISSPLTTNPTAPIKVDGTNPRYFNYGNKTVALIGISGEFVPQINWLKQVVGRGQIPTPTTKSTENCGLHVIDIVNGLQVQKYTNCIDILRAAGLNVMRIWVGLNHSPGKGDPPGSAPYRNEQPFTWNGSQWNMDSWDMAYDWALYDVIKYAQGKGLIVELTLFDPYGGDPATGPWKKANHIMDNHLNAAPCAATGNAEFSHDLMFTRGDRNYIFPTNPFPAGNTEALLDAYRIDTVSGAGIKCENLKTRRYQAEMVKHMVKLLNGKLYAAPRNARLFNFYWELANESDGNGAGIQNARNWHYYMAWLVREYERSLFPANTPLHLTAVNYELKPLLDELLTNQGARNYIDIVAGHYVKKANVNASLADVRVFEPTATTGTSTQAFGAISMIMSYGATGSATNSKIWAFNEGRITGFTYDPVLRPNPATPASARAEAWEFMLWGGAVYDHMGFNWGNVASPDAVSAKGTRQDLGRLAGVLINNTVDLKTMKRNQTWLNNPPVYGSTMTQVAGQPAIPSPAPKQFYAAMNNNDTFFYYRHNSQYSDNGAAPKYDPVFADNNAYREKVKFKNTYTCRATFTAEWIRPRANHPDIRFNGTNVGTPPPTPEIVTFTINSGALFDLTSSFYNYDIALKVKKTAFPTGCANPIPMTMTNTASSTNAATATASSELSEDYPASSVIDGDRSGNNWGHGGGWADATPGDYPDWVQVTYERAQKINEVDIFTLRDNYTDETEVTEGDKFSLYGVRDFELQYRDPETQDWVTIPNGVMAGNEMVWMRFTFESIYTDAIRVVVNRGAGYESPADDYSRIVEIETYANEETKGEEDATF